VYPHDGVLTDWEAVLAGLAMWTWTDRAFQCMHDLQAIAADSDNILLLLWCAGVSSIPLPQGRQLLHSR
jgi:hypothetical protein